MAFSFSFSLVIVVVIVRVVVLFVPLLCRNNDTRAEASEMNRRAQLKTQLKRPLLFQGMRVQIIASGDVATAALGAVILSL